MSLMFAHIHNGPKLSIYETQEYEKAYGKVSYFCPFGHQVIARRGSTKIWHFSHKSVSDCYSSRVENKMTPWHIKWQKAFKPDLLEVPFVNVNGKKNIADICLSSGLVIEIQHSPIKEDTIRERENNYDNMIWVFDRAETPCKIHWMINGYAYISGLNIPHVTKRCYVDLGSPDNGCSVIARVLSFSGGDYLLAISDSCTMITAISLKRDINFEGKNNLLKQPTPNTSKKLKDTVPLLTYSEMRTIKELDITVGIEMINPSGSEVGKLGFTYVGNDTFEWRIGYKDLLDILVSDKTIIKCANSPRT